VDQSAARAGEPGPEPARITITRNAPSDVKTRQLVVSIDGEHAATLLWQESMTRELAPGLHRIRVHNTLVWKTVDLTLGPGEHAAFEAINRPGKLTYFLVTTLGAGPLYLTLNRIR
jgi:hypothetical protein